MKSPRKFDHLITAVVNAPCLVTKQQALFTYIDSILPPNSKHAVKNKQCKQIVMTQKKTPQDLDFYVYHLELAAYEKVIR